MSDRYALHALFGGTFDPIHYGHLKPAEALAQLTGLEKVTLLPNNVPPHRPQPEATSVQRVAMVKLAISGNPLFDLDLREMQRDTPSYTIDTLAALRLERGKNSPWHLLLVRIPCLPCTNGIAGRIYCHFVTCWSVSAPAIAATWRHLSCNAGWIVI